MDGYHHISLKDMGEAGLTHVELVSSYRTLLDPLLIKQELAILYYEIIYKDLPITFQSDAFQAEVLPFKL